MDLIVNSNTTPPVAYLDYTPPTPTFPNGSAWNGSSFDTTIHVGGGGAPWPTQFRRLEVSVHRVSDGVEVTNRLRPVDSDYTASADGLEPETEYLVKARYFSHDDVPTRVSEATFTTPAVPEE